MSIQSAYNTWAATYDAVLNKTRDAEAAAIRQVLADVPFADAIEIGCGTGKNTAWLAEKAAHLIAVDFSAEMLSQAQRKIKRSNIRFQQADITKEWTFVNIQTELIACSLILEHIQNLNFVFQQAFQALKPGGFLYVGELHPFKQYQGSKARFENGSGIVELECFIHHVSEYMAIAKNHGFQCAELREWFDDKDSDAIPRIITCLFQK